MFNLNININLPKSLVSIFIIAFLVFLALIISGHPSTAFLLLVLFGMAFSIYLWVNQSNYVWGIVFGLCFVFFLVLLFVAVPSEWRVPPPPTNTITNTKRNTSRTVIGSIVNIY